MDQASGDERTRPFDAYVQAFHKAKSELQALQKKAFELKRRLADIDAEIEQKLCVAKSLAEAVAREGNGSLKRELQVLQKEPGHSPRTSVAYDAVRKLLSELWGPSDKLTTSDVLQKLKTQNIGVDPKAVYNALNYMEKTGKLRRLSRGHYLVTDGGYAVQSTHDVNRLEDREMVD